MRGAHGRAPWAHVTVDPDGAAKGASDVEIAFRVPNEEATNTTKLQVSIPTDHPLLGVLAQPVPGWTAKVTTVKLATPIHTDDGDISDAVSEVDWTANSTADGIAPGNYQRFQIIVGQLPADEGQIVFKALQTYANGDVVRWIETGADAEHPAPVFSLGVAAIGGGHTTPTTVPAATSTPTKSDDDSNTLGIIAIIVGGVALAVALGAMVAGRRRTPSA